MRTMLISQLGYVGLALEERPIPEPRAGEVQIQMRAASLNYRDIMLIQGRGTSGSRLPYVPLSCGCGLVTKTGEGVTRFKSGDRVAPRSFKTGSRDQGRLRTWAWRWADRLTALRRSMFVLPKKAWLGCPIC